MASRTRLPPPKKKKNRITQPSTADEFLAVGVEREEAAEKWRAGDAEKALRFYGRALENYDKALIVWPDNFDIAYNKARILFAVTQHPGLRALLPSPFEVRLSNALDAHRIALKLAAENADVLFNTAQVLSSLAEELAEDRQPEVIALLEESVALLQKCLDLQIDSLQKQSSDLDAVDESSHGSALSSETVLEERPVTPASTEEDEGDWARIEEPLTATTVLDTATALFDSLASLCKASIGRGAAKLSSIEELAGTIRAKLHKLELDVDDESRDESRDELLLADAKLKTAMLEAAFDAGTIDLKTFDNGVKETFESMKADKNASALLAFAEALLDLVTAAEGQPGSALLRWNRTSRALELLNTAAQSSPTTSDHAAIHMLRGDFELFRHRLTFDQELPDSLTSPAARHTLLANAGKYYRGATAAAQSDTQRGQQASMIKAALAACMAQENLESLEQLTQMKVLGSRIKEVVVEAVDELLIPETQVTSLGLNRLLQ